MLHLDPVGERERARKLLKEALEQAEIWPSPHLPPPTSLGHLCYWNETEQDVHLVFHSRDLAGANISATIGLLEFVVANAILLEADADAIKTIVLVIRFIKNAIFRLMPTLTRDVWARYERLRQLGGDEPLTELYPDVPAFEIMQTIDRALTDEREQLRKTLRAEPVRRGRPSGSLKKKKVKVAEGEKFRQAVIDAIRTIATNGERLSKTRVAKGAGIDGTNLEGNQTILSRFSAKLKRYGLDYNRLLAEARLKP